MKSQYTDMYFSTIKISASQIFYQKKYVYAFVNHKPFSEGHILVCPTRKEKKIQDLNDIESIELLIAVRNISSKLKKIYNTEHTQIVIQNGELAGQSIDHCHVHIIPIIDKDRNKDIKIDMINKEPRSYDDMEKEALLYRKELGL